MRDSRKRKLEKEALQSEAVANAVLLYQIIKNHAKHRTSGDEESRAEAERIAQELDRKLSSVVLGLTDSGGQGFSIPTSALDGLEAPSSSYTTTTIERYSSNMIIGYNKLSREAAEAAAKAFWHLREEKKRLEKLLEGRKLRQARPLDDLIRSAYIPTPRPIQQMPVIGPIRLGSVSILFTSVVQGHSLHDQWRAIKALPREPAKEQYQDLRLWHIARTTGVWEVIAPTVQMPNGIEEKVRASYSSMIYTSLAEFAEFAKMNLCDSESEALMKFCNYAASRLQIDRGNIVPYFDAAHRNFIDDALGDGGRNVDRNWTYKLLKKEGMEIDVLHDITVRIDLSHVYGKPVAAAEEDIAHNTENAFAGASRKRYKYHAATTLTRRALLAFYAGNAAQAEQLAEELEAIRQDALKPMESGSWKEYYDAHDITIRAMPTIRKIRQGRLALDYTKKTIRFAADASVVSERLIEAQIYASRAAKEWPELIGLLSAHRGPYQYGASLAYEILARASDLLKTRGEGIGASLTDRGAA